MAVAIQQISPSPLAVGAGGHPQAQRGGALIDTCCPPHPANVLSCGRGVEALLLAILDGHHALHKVGTRLEERGMVPPPAWPAPHGPERLPVGADPRCPVYRQSQPGVLRCGAQGLGGLCHSNAVAPSGYDDDHLVGRLCRGRLAESRLIPPRPAYGHSTATDHTPLNMGLLDRKE